MKHLQIILLCFLISTAMAQRSVGVLSYDATLSADGLNLIYPLGQSDTYLIDNCGEVVHSWQGSDELVASTVAYLLPDASLIRTCKPKEFPIGAFSAGGAGGVIQIVTWENDLLWQYEVLDSERRAHHDVEVLPSGNVLILAWERMSKVEMVEAGWDTIRSDLDELWSDYIMEVDPVTDSVVWEWHAWDHLVQDFDSTRNNYGQVGEMSHRININADIGSFGLRPDWLHTNAMDYHQEREQIVLSVPNFSEVWIIDHSTTTAEAQGGMGGRSGKGGDLLYRWGNPAMHAEGTENDQKLFFQHDAQWQTYEVQGVEYDAIMVYNNRKGGLLSEVELFVPTYDELNSTYLQESGVYLTDSVTSIGHPEPELAYSDGMSGAQILDNGNMLVCSSRRGYAYELSESRELVWEYIFPFRNGAAVPQGAELLVGENRVFDMNRYSYDYPAFIDKSLTSMGLLELEGENICTETSNYEQLSTTWQLYPNPASEYISIEGVPPSSKIKLTTLQGETCNSGVARGGSIHIDTSILSSGVYLVWIDGRPVEKIVVVH